MEKFTIYSKDNCTYCNQAKNLLRQHGLEFEEYVLPLQATKEEIQERVYNSGSRNEVRSVPQIFHGDMYVGGAVQLSDYMEKLRRMY
jgi:glutaredoxin